LGNDASFQPLNRRACIHALSRMVACSAGFSLFHFNGHGGTGKDAEMPFFLATFGSGFSGLSRHCFDI